MEISTARSYTVVFSDSELTAVFEALENYQGQANNEVTTELSEIIYELELFLT